MQNVAKLFSMRHNHKNIFFIKKHIANPHMLNVVPRWFRQNFVEQFAYFQASDSTSKHTSRLLFSCIELRFLYDNNFQKLVQTQFMPKPAWYYNIWESLRGAHNDLQMLACMKRELGA